MELFKFNDPDTFSNGEAIDGYDAISWTERYRELGEIEIKAPLSSGLKQQLPEGTLVAQVESLDVMQIEDHQIKDEDDKDPYLSITGRSLPCLLDHRIIGQNVDWTTPPPSIADSQYVLAANYTWVQAVTLINDYIQAGVVVNAGDAIPSLLAAHDMSGTGVSEERPLRRGSVLKSLLDILKIDDLGIRVIRAHNFDQPQPGPNTTFLIHDGVDRRNQVIFSTRNGDIDAADYLWSIKTLKTSALVSGKFVEQMVHGSQTGMDRRVMLVDGSDLDGHLETIPTGVDLTAIRDQMTIRGMQALTGQRRLALSRTDISRTPTYEYRKDYNIGDIVAVDTSYGPVQTMRVVEYVQIEDENGESAHPTLEILED